MILDEIVQYKKIEVGQQKDKEPLEDLIAKSIGRKLPRSFSGSLKKAKDIGLIAEIKKASPSRGLICKDFDHIRMAKAYQENGAAAISVLTDENFFQGSLSYMSDVVDTVKIPVLRKDFIIDSYQIYQARAYGADAILLIAAILSKDEMESFLRIARKLGMECLVEVHNREELEKVLQTSAQIIGINNRDLQTFKVSLQTTYDLLEHIGPGKLIVSESGIFERSQVEELQQAGVDGILVGESIAGSGNIDAKIKELLGSEIDG